VRGEGGGETEQREEWGERRAGGESGDEREEKEREEKEREEKEERG
jgi:hypothetical protein